MSTTSTAGGYPRAREAFAAHGVDPEAALARLDAVPVTVALTAGGPGHGRSADPLRADADAARRQIPGATRFCLDALQLEADGPVELDGLRPEHFQRWVDWAKERGLGLDFQPSCASPPPGRQGLTLSHPDPAVRRFWIEHCQASRTVSAHLGRSLGTPSTMALRVPDRWLDPVADRLAPRQRLLEALDEVLAAPIPRLHHRDALGGARRWPGAEAGAAGSSGFYLACAVRRDVMLSLEAGPAQVAEIVSDELGSALPFLDRVVLHLGGGAGDGEALLDGAPALAQALVRGGVLDRVALVLDHAEAALDPVSGWVMGVRSLRRALLRALLEPAPLLDPADVAARLARREEVAALPWAAVWDHYCESRGVPPGLAWLGAVGAHQRRASGEPRPAAAAPPPGATPASRAPAGPTAYGVGLAVDAEVPEVVARLFRSAETAARKGAICDIGRRLWQRAYVDGNGGNVSVRLTDDLVLCTPTLVSKGFMSPDDLCLVDMDGVQRAGTKRATSEILMHLAIYRAQPLARACVHAHPPRATAFAIAGVSPPGSRIPEMEVFCGEVPVAPYFTPGTREMGEAVARLADHHNTILMGNHGAVAWGADVQDAYFKMEILESYCITALATAQLGAEPNRFSPEQLGALLAIKKRLGIPDPRLAEEPPMATPAAGPPRAKGR